MKFNSFNDFLIWLQTDIQQWNTALRTESGTNDDYKLMLSEKNQFLYIIEDCKAVVSNFEILTQYPMWTYGEILSEIFALNPPLMHRYKPEVIEWAYKLRPDKSAEYMYGRRWNEWNQLLNIINLLAKRPDSKRAVIDIFTPYDTDNSRNDVPCVPGHTQILSPEGDKSIEELYNIVEINKKKYPVYSVNENTKQIEIKYIEHVFKKKPHQLFRIIFDNEDYIDITEEHEIYIKTHGGKKYEKTKVKDLKINDRIIPFTRFYSKKGISYHQQLNSNWSCKAIKKVSHEYARFLNFDFSSNEDIHHINGNSYENFAENLQILTHSEHSSLTMRTNNRMFKDTYQQLHSIKLKETMKRLLKQQSKVKSNKKFTSTQLISVAKKMYNDLGVFNISVWTANKYKYGIPNGIGSRNDIKKRFNSYSEFSMQVKNNHKIKQIINLNITEIVYDMEVEDNHNYFIKFNNLENQNIDRNEMPIRGCGKAIQEGLLISNCTLMYNFKIKNNKLNMTVFYRSHDIFAGLKYDVLLSSFINQLICMGINATNKELQIEPGNLAIYENSLHFYPKKDKELYTKFINENIAGTQMKNFDFMFNYNSINELYDDLWYVMKAEQSSYYGNFKFAVEKMNKIINPKIKEIAEYFIKRNIQYHNSEMMKK